MIRLFNNLKINISSIKYNKIENFILSKNQKIVPLNNRNNFNNNLNNFINHYNNFIIINKNKNYYTTSSNKSSSNISTTTTTTTNNNNNINEILKSINEKPNTPGSYLKLYQLMFHSGKKDETIKLLSGETIDTIEILKRELNNNPNDLYTRFALCFTQIESIDDDLLNKKVKQPTYIWKNEINQSKINNNNYGGNTEYNGIDLLTIMLDIDPMNSDCLKLLTESMIAYNLSKWVKKNGKELTIEQVVIKNYLKNKDIDINSFFYLCNTILPITKIEISDIINNNHNNNNKEFLDIKQELLNGLEIYPNESKLYYYLSKVLPNNWEPIQLANGKQVTKLGLLVKSIEILSIKLKDDENDEDDEDDGDNIEKEKESLQLSLYYFDLAYNLNDNTQNIQIFNKKFNKQSLFIKSLEINPINQLAIEYLIATMKPNQNIQINNESFDRDELIQNYLFQNFKLNSSILQIGYSILTRVYESDGDKIKSDYYKKLLVKEKETSKENLLYQFYNQLNKKDETRYLKLEKLLNHDETVQIDGETIGKKECFIKTIEINDKVSNFLYTKLSKLLKPDTDDTVTINGKQFNKKQLLEKELIYNNPETLYDYSFECNAIFDQQKDFDDLSIFDFESFKLINTVTFSTIHPRYYKPYSYVGEFLSRYSFEFLNQVPIIENLKNENDKYSLLSLSKKQLFSKSLILSDPIYPTISIDNFNIWYSLAEEMNFIEQELKKSKVEILLELLNINPNVSGIYNQLSKSLKDNSNQTLEINNKKFTKTQLILESLKLEKEFTELKTDILINLSKQYFSGDDKEIIETSDGNFNKKQLLIYILENCPPILDKEEYLYKELIETMEFNNYDTVLINNIEYSIEMLEDQLKQLKDYFN